MKKIFISMMAIGIQSFGMSNLLDGIYEGKGRWQDTSGGRGTYLVETKISSNRVSSTYRFGGSLEVFEFQTQPSSKGFFRVLVHGSQVGEGYCMSVQCHYDFTLGNVELEETLTFWQGNLYRVGSKNIGGKMISWEERLSQ